MKIFYTASFYGKEKYQKEYDMVLSAIRQNNVELLSPETGNYLNVLNAKRLEKLKDRQKIHYEAIRKGIGWAQAVIIEISNEDFQLGHEATLAIQSKKHVLALSIHENFSRKIMNPYFHGLKYNQYNIEEGIEEFIKMAREENLDQRFNLFLSQNQINYLQKAADKNDLNKSEYIRLLIDNDRK